MAFDKIVKLTIYILHKLFFYEKNSKIIMIHIYNVIYYANMLSIINISN